MLSTIARIAVAFVLLAPVDAFACSCGVDEYDWIWTADGVIPANQGGFIWEFGHRGGYPTDVVVQREEDSQWVDVEHTEETSPLEDRNTQFIRVPAVRDDVGGRYRVLKQRVDLDKEAEIAVFEVGPPLDADQTVGLVVDQPRSELVNLPSSSCVVEAKGRTAEIEVELSENLEAARDLLWFETIIDDRRVRYRESACSNHTPGQSWQGRGVDKVVAACGSPSNTDVTYAPDVYDVSMEIFLPGTNLSWTTESEEVDLRCGLGGGCQVAGSSHNVWPLLTMIILAGCRRRSPQARARPAATKSRTGDAPMRHAHDDDDAQRSR